MHILYMRRPSNSTQGLTFLSSSMKIIPTGYLAEFIKLVRLDIQTSLELEGIAFRRFMPKSDLRWCSE